MTAMAQSTHSYVLGGQDNRWLFWVGLSLLLHAALFAFGWYLAHRPDTSAPRYEQPIIVTTMAWAPDVREKHWMPRKAPTEEAVVKPTTTKVAVNPDETKAKAAEDDEKKKAEAEKKARQERQKRMNAALGKIKNDYNSWDGSPDGVKGGLSAEAQAILGSIYAGKLREVFHENFVLPKTIPHEDVEKLKAEILVKIDRSGKIISHTLVVGSGNGIFDSAALGAIQKTRKVPLPDDDLKDIVFKQGIQITFSWTQQTGG